MTTKLVLINITQDHIGNGVRGNDEKCPIALACNEMKDVFGEEGVFVGETKIFKSKSCVKYKLPLEAKAFVWSFDNKGPKSVEPFSFEIDLNREKFW